MTPEIPAFSSKPPALSDELIAPGDPLYTRLAQAARLGLLPGWSPVDFLRGDRLFTWRQLAPLLEKLPTKSAFLVVGNAPRAFAADSAWQVQATKEGITAAELKTSWRGWELSAGRKPLRWGPGWSGGMLFSDANPPLDRVSIQKNIGRLTFEQFYGQFFEPSDPGAPQDTASGTRRHLAGRRLTLRSNGPWELSAGEAIKALRLPDPALAAALPWYVYQHDWSAIGSGRWLGLPRSAAYKNSSWLNYMADLSVVYRQKNGTRLYGEYLLDDIKAPTFLGGTDTTPQRSGLLLGAAGETGPLAWRLEAVDTNRRTYRSDVQANWWNRGDAPLGNPLGPNASQLFARADYKVNTRLSLALEAEHLRRSDTSQPGPQRLNRLTLFVAQTLTPQSYATARLERDGARLTFGWMP
jgi:Capsule assembly protein Wzi